MMSMAYPVGLPLLYMCVTVPLGFLIHEDPDYGYETAYVLFPLAVVISD